MLSIEGSAKRAVKSASVNAGTNTLGDASVSPMPSAGDSWIANDQERSASDSAEHVAALEARVELLQKALNLATAGLRLEYPGEGAVVDTLPFEVKQVLEENHIMDEGLEHRQPNGQILSIAQRKLADGAVLTVVQNITDERLAREALEREALTDQVTGVSSFRAAEILAEELIQIYTRYRRTFSMLRIDALGLDDHAVDARDTIIRHVANVGRRSLRAVDILARIEGGCFVAILPESDREGAIVAAKRLCYKLEAADLMISGKTIDTPVCVGVQEYDASFETFNNLRKAADVKLTKAKEAHHWTVV